MPALIWINQDLAQEVEDGGVENLPATQTLAYRDFSVDGTIEGIGLNEAFTRRKH